MNTEKTKSFQNLLRKTKCYSQNAVFFVFFSLLMITQLQAQNAWNQFRGPSKNGVLTDVDFPDKLPDKGPELSWSVDVGNGFPEVAVAKGVAYIFSSDSLDGGYEYVAALNAETGKELWKTKVDSMWFEVDGWGHGPRATPAVDDQKLYCVSGFAKFKALNLKNGEILWSVNLPENFGSIIPRWGFTSSPLLVGDLVILETGGTEERAFTAFDKQTGEVVWSKGTGPSTYNSPALVTIDGQENIVFANDSMLTAYNSQGDKLWDFRMPLRMPTAMPVFIPPNKFFVSSVSKTGGFFVEVNGNKPMELLQSTTMQNNWSSSCYCDGYLYGFSKAKLQCVSVETGEMQWGKRGFGKGSLIMVGDKLLVLSDQGQLTVVKAKPDQYTEIGSFKALEGKSWTAPVYVNGHIFVRNLSTLACYTISK